MSAQQSHGDENLIGVTESQSTESKLKPWRAYEPCPGCGGTYQSFGPGRLSSDGTVEVRTHDDPHDGCGAEIHTIPYFTTSPGEADTWGLD